MMQLAWLTDIHLNFLDDAKREHFLETVADQADAFVITGDIGESPKTTAYLKEMEEILRKPIYFVLGNHDFYRGSISETRDEVAKLAEQSEFLVYLTATTVVELSPKTALIGHVGWADARFGDFHKSDVFLNDYVAIQELRKPKGEFGIDKPALEEALNALGDEAANHLEVVLQQAVADHSSVIALTHVPPFKEAAWYEGRHSDDNYLPHFACKATGDALRNVMYSQPLSRLLVLCGHTHGQGEVQITENLHVLTGEAEYGQPVIQRVFDIE
jgi:predicted MPP superfamily phosphohydrolase